MSGEPEICEGAERRTVLQTRRASLGDPCFHFSVRGPDCDSMFVVVGESKQNSWC